MGVMNSIVNCILEDMIDEARILLERHDRGGFTSREALTATRLYFPGEICKHAVSEGTKACTKYSCNEGEEEVKVREKKELNEKSAGLTFPASIVHKVLKNKLRYNISATGCIFVTAVLEYITAEILELSCKALPGDLKVRRLTPRQIGLGIRGDDELDRLLPGVIAGAGVIPHIHKSLIRKFEGLNPSEDESISNSTFGNPNENDPTFGSNTPQNQTAFTFGSSTTPVNETGFAFAGGSSTGFTFGSSTAPVNQTGFTYGSNTTPQNQTGFIYGGSTGFSFGGNTTTPQNQTAFTFGSSTGFAFGSV